MQRRRGLGVACDRVEPSGLRGVNTQVRWTVYGMVLVCCGCGPAPGPAASHVARPVEPAAPQQIGTCRVGFERVALQAAAFDVAAADVDGDGGVELIVAGRDGVRAMGEPLGAARSRLLVSAEASELAVARDSNSTANLVLRLNSAVETWRNDGTGQFVRGDSWPTAESMAVADLDGDGRDDLITARGTQVSVVLAVASSDAELVPLSVDVSPQWLASGDLNADGVDDLVVGDDVWIQVFVGSRDRELRGGKLIRIPAAYGAAVADLDGDGRGELITSNAGTLVLSFDKGLGHVETRPHRDVFRPIEGEIAVADFDGDGTLDVSALTSGTGRILVWPGRSSGTLGPPRSWWSPPGDHGFRRYVVADLNADGRVDVASVAGAAAVDVVLGGTPATVAPGSRLRSIVEVAATDHDRDGHLDLIAFKPCGPRRPKSNEFPFFVAAGRGDGTFEDFEAQVVVGACPVTPLPSADAGALGVVAVVPGASRRTAPDPKRIQVSTGWAGFEPSLAFLTLTGNRVIGPTGEGVPLSVWPASFAARRDEAGASQAVVYSGRTSKLGLARKGGQTELPLPEPAADLAAGDHDGDGVTDLLVSSRDSSGRGRARLLVGPRLATAFELDLGSNEQATFADIDGDAAEEIVVVGPDAIRWASHSPEPPIQWQEAARARPTVALERSVVEVLPLPAAASRGLAIIDTDGVEHMRLRGGSLTTTAYTPSGFRLTAAATGDFDEDGSPDIVAVGASPSPLIIPTATCLGDSARSPRH